jgi:transglutaminase-like putative cysteine protease
MKIRVGYELSYLFPQPTPVLLVLNIHYTRSSDVLKPDLILTDPSLPIGSYRDTFGNWCSRILAPAGRVRITADGVVNDTGLPDVVAGGAGQCPVQALPEEALMFLLGSRYCETDRLSETAWKLFAGAPTGWGRVQAICDFVHQHIEFGYAYANPTKTAWDVFNERKGVCRDYAHLAVTLCRCMNIPARYCTGYLGDIGVPAAPEPMDFAGWFEAYLGGQWYTFDARNNHPRAGRILIARGRDAADVAITTTFGPNTLEGFRVWAEAAS